MVPESQTPVGLRDRQNRDIVIHAEVRALENQKKEAVVLSVQPEGVAWTIQSDEGPWVGGDSTAPPPLAFFTSSVAF
jgi:hypothetical protein